MFHILEDGLWHGDPPYSDRPQTEVASFPPVSVCTSSLLQLLFLGWCSCLGVRRLLPSVSSPPPPSGFYVCQHTGLGPVDVMWWVGDACRSMHSPMSSRACGLSPHRQDQHRAGAGARAPQRGRDGGLHRQRFLRHRHDHRHGLSPTSHHRGGGRHHDDRPEVGDVGTSRRGLCRPQCQLWKVPQALSLDMRNSFILVPSVVFVAYSLFSILRVTAF